MLLKLTTYIWLRGVLTWLNVWISFYITAPSHQLFDSPSKHRRTRSFVQSKPQLTAWTSSYRRSRTRTCREFHPAAVWNQCKCTTHAQRGRTNVLKCLPLSHTDTPSSSKHIRRTTRMPPKIRYWKTFPRWPKQPAESPRAGSFFYSSKRQIDATRPPPPSTTKPHTHSRQTQKPTPPHIYMYTLTTASTLIHTDTTKMPQNVSGSCHTHRTTEPHQTTTHHMMTKTSRAN